MQNSLFAAVSSADQARELLSILAQKFTDLAKGIPVEFEKDWSLRFPESPGVYVIHNTQTILYVGETADIRARMRDLKDTRNHTFRRSIGKKLTGMITTASKKFDSDIEKQINEWLKLNARVQFIEIFLARKELETWLIHKFQPIYNRSASRNQMQ